MSQYSEMMGSFIRTGNYPLEANYIFANETELKTFYEDPLNKTILHPGLLKLVLDNGEGKQALYWVVDDLFEELISFGDIDELKEKLNDLEEKLNQEIKDRTIADLALWGTLNPTDIDPDLNSIYDLSKAVKQLRNDLAAEALLCELRYDELKDDIKAVVGTEEDDIKTYLNTLDYLNLTKISEALNKFLNTIDEENPKINTLPEIQRFLEGYTDLDTLKDLLKNILGDVYGDPYPSEEFRTFRGVEDFVRLFKSESEHTDRNLQTELDLTQVGVGLSGDGSYNADLETNYLKDATSVMNALKILDSLINEAINNCNLKVKDSESVELDIIKESDKTTITAKVKVSSEDGNDILIKNDGIYNTIDSEYENGILTIKVNGNVRLQHVLGLSSVVESAHYDPDLESIIIIFKLLNGEKQIITIPAGSLIQEWEVDNTHPTKVVELTKERVISGGADKLSADVRISSNKYNILEKENNTLLVKGTADNIIVEGGTTVKAELERLTNEDRELHALISDEITRASSIEDLLNLSLKDETNRAKLVEQDLDHKITNEVTRATDAETLLNHRIDDISNELSDSNSSIISLQEKTELLSKDINDETNRAKNAELSLSNDITLLRTDVETKDGDLLNKIELEKVRAETLEKVLETKIETVKDNIETNINTQISSLLDSLNNEITRSTQEDSDIRNEIASLKLVDVTLQNNINLEELRATNAETLLDHKIDDLKNQIKDSLEGNNDAVNSELLKEIDRATAAEQVISDELRELINKCIVSGTFTVTDASVELAKLGQGYTTLQEVALTLKSFLDDNDFANSTINRWKEIESFLNGITDLLTLLGLLEAMKAECKADKQEIRDLLSAEIVRALKEEQEIRNLLNLEKLRAENAEKVIESKLDTSISVLETKIETVKENVETNIGNKIDTLQDSLNLEISRSTLKDDDLDARINNLSILVASEITRATSEENVINQRIDNIKDSLDVTIHDLTIISEKLNAEIVRSVNKDTELENLIYKETHALEDKLGEHIHDYDNPHKVTAQQIGLGKVDNTSDLEKPISVATQGALNTINIEVSKKADNADLLDHILDNNNPHRVTKGQLDLGNVDNTSDLNKPISTATQMALDKKAEVHHTHTMIDIIDLEVPPVSKGFVNLIAELPEDAQGGDKYILTTEGPNGKYRYTLMEYDGSDGTWKLKLLTTGTTTSVIGGDVYKLTSEGPERMLDASDYTYFYDKIYNETKDLIEDIDWEENDETNDTNQLIRLKITYKTSYGDPNESESTNPYQEKAVKYIDIEKARFLSNAYSRPATNEDVTNGYATTVGEPLLILVLTTGDHVTISLKEALNIYDPVDTPSIDMSVSDWTGNPSTSYKVSADVRIASTLDKTDAISLHILDGTEKGLYSTLHTTNTNSITLTPNYGTSGSLKSLTADLNINNSLNSNSDVLLTVDSSGLSAKIIWGEYD